MDLYTSYENANVFATSIREDALQSVDIQSVMDYRAFVTPCCSSFYLMKHGEQILKSCLNGLISIS